jgi:hydroxypyruvate isomerase
MDDKHSLAYALNCGTLLLDVPPVERPAAAAAAGFEWVELWWPFERAVPTDAEVDAFARRVEDAGVQVACLSLANQDISAAVAGDLTLDGPIDVLTENATIGAELAVRLGCRTLNRRWSMRVDGVDPKRQDDNAVRTFGALADAVRDTGTTLAFEAVSQVPRYPIVHTSDALAMLDRITAETGADNVGMVADLYHLACSGDDVDAEIATHGARFAHVQIADSPGRGQPGSGRLPIQRWLSMLEKGGYRGTVGLEYYANNDPDPFAWIPRERRAKTSNH